MNIPYDPNSPFHKAVRAHMEATSTPVELGWEILRKAKASSNAHFTDKELFMAGAGYMFDAIITAMTPGDEPTEQDLALLSKFHAELLVFHEHFNRKLKL